MKTASNVKMGFTDKGYVFAIPSSGLPSNVRFVLANSDSENVFQGMICGY